jgi:hypothetical protein
MSTGSLATFAKNAKNFFPGLATYCSNLSANAGALKKMKDRQWNHAPEPVKEQAEVYEPAYWKRHLSQDKNMWVDKDLSKEVSQKELAKLTQFKIDSWRLLHCGVAPLAVFGGLALPVQALWLGNDTHVPSTFAQTAEEKKAYLAAQDLYRYKFAPGMITNFKWFVDFHVKLPESGVPAWEELFEKNDVRRDVKVLMPALHKMYDAIQPFHFIRRQQARAIGRAMGIPTFPTWGKICLQKRIADYWELIWNEDYMVLSQKLHTKMSDEELYDYAWRRYLAPYDKNLSREQVTERVEDYFAFLGGQQFLETQQAPNIFCTIVYCMGYYNDPAYLEMDFAELEKNDFEHLSYWAKDAFMQRLEFENGPLRDQVEAHTVKKLAEHEAKVKTVTEEVNKQLQ